MVVGTIERVKETILNLYAPIEDCPSFFKKIASLLAEKGMISIGGDFNCILERKLDRLPVFNGPKLKKSETLGDDGRIRASIYLVLSSPQRQRLNLHVSGAQELLQTFLALQKQIYTEHWTVK